MEIFLIKSGYHNEYHVENLASIFLIFTPTCGQVEILVAIWLHDASKKIVDYVARLHEFALTPSQPGLM
jgi:hypothetical protein